MTSRRVSKKQLENAYAIYDQLDRDYTLDELTPLQAVYYFCKKCIFESSISVRNCGRQGNDRFKRCKLYKYRMGKLNGNSEKDVLKTIHSYCTEECCDGEELMVSMCEGQTCPLYHYRHGKNPKRQKAAKDKDNLSSNEK
jgi:hypothetical protein